ncbi:hypothetical protein [Mycobacterium intracellulare]|uniref:hypothetical protein n=1 Tax=Mycobacterium intracellulare TaxID=1767 RepID=UPI001EEF4FF9|nr:hypothetical protein [Mycobacterium intracellulare]MEE3755329.1 hypothetical protein [Mycobacterium intracellulare]
MAGLAQALRCNHEQETHSVTGPKSGMETRPLIAVNAGYTITDKGGGLPPYWRRAARRADSVSVVGNAVSARNAVAVDVLAAITGRSAAQARPDDRRAIRRALRHLPVGHRLLRAAEDPDAVHAFLTRLAAPHE